MRIAAPTGHDDVPISLTAKLYTPEIAKAAMEFSRVTYVHSKLSLREFEAARMVTAQINGCQLCQNWRSAADLPLYLRQIGDASGTSVADRGETPDEAFYLAIDNWKTSDLYNSRERLAMEMAEGMGLDPKGIAADEDFWARIHALYSDAEIVDLTYCISCWMALGRMTHVLGLDGACSLPTLQAAE